MKQPKWLIRKDNKFSHFTAKTGVQNSPPAGLTVQQSHFNSYTIFIMC